MGRTVKAIVKDKEQNLRTVKKNENSESGSNAVFMFSVPLMRKS